MPSPTCPHCQASLPPSGTTCPRCGGYVPGWLWRAGAVHGPYDWETLELLYHQGRIRPDDRLTWDPEGNWLTPAEAFSAPVAPVAPPAAPPVVVAPYLRTAPASPPASPPAAVPPLATLSLATPSPATHQPAAPRRGNRWLWLAPLLALLIFLAGTAVGTFFVGQGVGFVRQTAAREQCAGQLKVIALGMRMYALDYGALPPGDNWAGALESRGIPRATWYCPARRDRLPYPVAPHLDLHRLKSGDRTLPVAADAPLPTGRGPHQGKFNVVYADGHVEESAHSPLPGAKSSVVALLPVSPSYAEFRGKGRQSAVMSGGALRPALGALAKVPATLAMSKDAQHFLANWCPRPAQAALTTFIPFSCRRSTQGIMSASDDTRIATS